MSYPFADIDKKWQTKWVDNQTFKAESKSSKPKYYVLDMFPYPSGSGLHVGHLASYTSPDVIARYKRAKGFNVLHPMGYDAFGLPAEQYAIKTGIHPAKTTEDAITNFRRQLQSFGYSFDWQREVSTADPKFYKWTQFIFKKLFEKGLAYQKEVPVNWCPALRTVLANEEVVDGKSERGGHPVVRLPMKQWMLKITAYADRLLEDLDKVEWPDRTREGQKNWIGKSEGAKVRFKVDGLDEQLEIFTTRPDTLFGATFMVLAPEHPLVEQITSAEQATAVKDYVAKAAVKSEVDRKKGDEKTGAFTGGYAIHPLTGKQIPIWIADYVMMDYGTGAIMAVPAHDERDFEFATQFEIPIVRVVQSEDELPYTGDGQLVNSDFLNGLNKEQAISKMIDYLVEHQLGEKQVNYKLRDWLFSRQRYWGEPFPVVQFPEGDLKAIPDNELPVLLPDVADYEPSEKGEPPLARVDDFVNYTDKDGKAAFRITDTMPGSAGSSWYFLRYTDPHNDDAPFSQEAQDYWMPVDLYVGGPEHTVGHLLYARFWQKVLFDAGLVTHEEPFHKLAHQGMLLGTDGVKMSKSRGNVINPDDVREQFGADALRAYICFMGPFERDKPWSTTGIEGVKRFLDRVWRLAVDDEGQVITQDDVQVSKDLEKTFHKTIKKVGEDIENMGHNTAISAMMILVNELYKEKVRPTYMIKTLMQLLNPFAPHMASELWEKLGESTELCFHPWPDFDPDLVVDDVKTMGVQVLGKMRGTIEVTDQTSEEEAVAMAKEVGAVANALEGKNIVKVIYKPGKILNLIAK